MSSKKKNYKKIKYLSIQFDKEYLKYILEWRYKYRSLEVIEQKYNLRSGILNEKLSVIPSYNGNRTSIDSWLINIVQRSSDGKIRYRKEDFAIITIKLKIKKMLWCGSIDYQFWPKKIYSDENIKWFITEDINVLAESESWKNEFTIFEYFKIFNPNDIKLIHSFIKMPGYQDYNPSVKRYKNSYQYLLYPYKLIDNPKRYIYEIINKSKKNILNLMVKCQLYCTLINKVKLAEHFYFILQHHYNYLINAISRQEIWFSDEILEKHKLVMIYFRDYLIQNSYKKDKYNLVVDKKISFEEAWDEYVFIYCPYVLDIDRFLNWAGYLKENISENEIEEILEIVDTFD